MILRKRQWRYDFKHPSGDWSFGLVMGLHRTSRSARRQAIKHLNGTEWPQPQGAYRPLFSDRRIAEGVLVVEVRA